MSAVSELDYYELEPEENHFYSVAADVTHRCNMECANCYIPNRDVPDMDADRLIDCISRFPSRCEIRVIGAEPTVRRDLPKILSRIRDSGHRPAMMTNGLRLANYDYAKKIYDAGLRTLNISLNGADDDDVYAITDSIRCARKKMAALRNCSRIGFFINTNTIIMRGVNEHVPSRLKEIADEIGCNIVMRFRQVGQLGRYTQEHEENYPFEEFVRLVAGQFGKSYDYVNRFHEVNGYEEERVVLFPLEDGRRFKTSWVKITDWSPARGSIPDPGSRRRGRITQNFKVAPFFEHVKLNEFGY